MSLGDIKEVGDYTGTKEAIDAKYHNAAIVASSEQQMREIAGKAKDNASKSSSSSAPKAQNSAEATVYGDALLSKLTGGSATVELAEMGFDILRDGLDTNNLGGMEKPVPPQEDGFRSITTSPFNDIFARSTNTGKAIAGDKEDAPKGLCADEKCIAALVASRNLGLSALGRAVQKEAKLGNDRYQAQQMGIAPGGGGMRPQGLALDQRSPKGPTDAMLTDESGAA